MGREARIHDYAIIGDGRSTALVSRRGALDWLCWPRFDCASLFGAVLDEERGGTWRVGPPGPARVERAYLEDTNVLCTRFHVEGGTLEVVDLMPMRDEPVGHVVAEHQVLRCVSCERGEVEVEVLYDPRPEYGRVKRPRLEDGGRLGWRLEHERLLVTLRADVDLRPRPEGGLYARFRLRAGERRHFSLTATDDAPAVLPPLGDFTREYVERTTRAWRKWLGRCQYDGPYQREVRRSALVLKTLTFGPSGAVVAAPTTSLPEVLGGSANWDYRYCWVRDSALTARALFGLGYEDEAEAFVTWLLRASWLTQPRMKTFYDVYGRVREKERELPWLRGHAGSRPVRVGNLAASQLQLDSYGEVIDAVAHLARRGGHLDREELKMLRRFGEYVTEVWDQPDEGIWEPRTGRRRHTFSRLMCWAALDRLLELHQLRTLPGIPVERFVEHRERLRLEIETRGWNQRLRSYVKELDGDEVEADLLLMAWYGFENARSWRMQGTHALIEERLGVGDELLYRGESSPERGEGAFGICCFWRAEFLARGGGPFEKAEEVFHRVLRHANDVGLFGEELEPETGEARGNFPQAFTHVGLISAALALEEARRHRQPVWRPRRWEEART